MKAWLWDIFEDINIAVHETLIPFFIIVSTFALMACAAHGATTQPATLYKLGNTPTTVADRVIVPALKQNAFEITGTGHTVRNVRVQGGWHGIMFPGRASNVIIDDFECVNPIVKDGGGYGMFFSRGGGFNSFIYVRDFKLVIPAGGNGQHCLRAYGLRNCVFTNGYLEHEGSYEGGTLLIKEAKSVWLDNVSTIGRAPALGPNPGDPQSYTVEDVTWRGGRTDMNGFQPKNKKATAFNIGPRCKDIWIVDREIIQRAPVPVFDIKPGQNVHIWNCNISGGTDLNRGGSIAGIDWTGSTYNGVAIP